MGRLFLVDLEGSSYSCKHCRTPLALKDDIISKYFCSRNRRAYLFYNVENVTYGPREDRMMLTGKHTVADIFCVVCGSILGWKYIYAYVKAHKYKEGWFVIERCKVLNPAGTPYEVNQEAQVGQQAPNGQETWMAQEAQAGGGIDVDNA
ncbi:protein yippee-like [Populus alba x Populus x berolinensis]|nr:protein yippee-like [Populus alba x Populus x berolinensis]